MQTEGRFTHELLLDILRTGEHKLHSGGRIRPPDHFASNEVNKKCDGFVVSVCLFLYLPTGVFHWNEEIPGSLEFWERKLDSPCLISFHPALSLLLVVARDRVTCVWQTVRDHLYHLCVNAMEFCFLVERAVVGLLRLAIRLLRREEISAQVRDLRVFGYTWRHRKTNCCWMDHMWSVCTACNKKQQF